jgi:hypothetical protein
VSALAHSLKRIWSAKDRVPRLTGRGISGSCSPSPVKDLVRWSHDTISELIHMARRTAPTVVVVALNFFR